MNAKHVPDTPVEVPGNDFIVGDIHVPYQDDAAVDVVIKMARKFKPDNIVINGDLVDCNPLSSFSKEPIEPAAFKAEMDEACDIISDLQRYSNVVLIEGNHESRFYRYVNDKAPALYGITSMREMINERLDTPIEYVFTTPKESMMEWGEDLLIGHWNVARKYTCYTAKALVDRFQMNCVQGHTHRLGQYSVRPYKTTLMGWEGGCLCDLNPQYVLNPNWSQGFLTYTKHDSGWNIEVVSINDGEAFYRGDVYRG